jgi:hypothetical protein
MVFGASMSLFTGRAEELPKWNGFDYMLFCAREGAMLGTVAALPLAATAFMFAWIALSVGPHRSD